MAACGSLEHIFEKPLPESPTLLESLSPWKQIKSMQTADHSSSFTEIFGELHFKENHDHPPDQSSSPSSSLSSNTTMMIPTTDANPTLPSINIPKSNDNEISIIHHHEKNGGSSTSGSYCPYGQKKQYKHRHSDSFSSMNSESLSICTEGLGSESFDDVEDLFLTNDICNNNNDCQPVQEERRRSFTRHNNTPAENDHNNNNWGESKRSRTSIGEFPPPISCIGRSGKPWVCFKSFRENGRFILKEIRIPTQEFLHACRENGRLKLQFIQSDDEFVEDDEEDDEENNEDSGKKDDGDRREIDRIGENEGREGEENIETCSCNVQGGG